MKLSRRRIIYLAAAALIALLVVYAFIPDPLPVETAKVDRGPLVVTVREQGKTRVIDRFTITAPVAGRLQRIDLREGTPIAAGEVVARIEPSPLDPGRAQELQAMLDSAVASQREAAAAAQRAASSHDLARSELRRMEQLAGGGVASEASLDQARSAADAAGRELNAAQARVRAAESNVQAARARLVATRATSPGATAEVRSPAAGRILRISDRSARVILPGQPILEVGNANRLELVVEVLYEDAVKIRAGNPVIVREWGGSDPLRGVVRLVEPSAFTKISALGIEEQRVNVVADVPDPPPSLGDAYRIEAEVVIWEEPAAVRVPVSALGRVGDDWAVFVVEGGRARRRIVQIGQRSAAYGQVLGGLGPGEIVIVHPAAEVEEGVKVVALGG
jgi:HlyD family secretion protein